MVMNELKQLEESINTLERLIEQAKEQSDFYEVDSSFNQWFKDFKIRFDAFKKQCVCIPKNKLEELIKERPKYKKDFHCESWALNDVEYWFSKLEKLFEESK